MVDYKDLLKTPYLWRRANRENSVTKKAPISLRIEIAGYPRAEFATGVFATPQEWSQDRQRLVVARGMSKAEQKLLEEDNDTLLDKVRIVKQAYRTYRSQGADPSPVQLRDLLRWGKTKEQAPLSLVALMSQMRDNLQARGMGKSSHVNAKRSEEAFLEYMAHAKQLQLLAIDVDRAWCRSFERWALAKPWAGATIRKRMVFLFGALNMAVDEGLLKENKTTGYKYLSSVRQADKHCLPKEEVVRLRHFVFSEVRLTRAAHIFLFCCYTGLAHIDYTRFAKDPVPFLHYVEPKEGLFVLGIQMQRQKLLRADKDPDKVKHFFVPLFEHTRELFFTVYRGELPFFTARYLNGLLKRVAEEAELSIIDLSHKDARTTFSQHSRDQFGDAPTLVMAGHTQRMMDAHYSVPSEKRAVEEMMLLGAKFNTTSN